MISAVETVSYVAPKDLARDEKRLSRARLELEAARKRAKLATLEELAAAQPEHAAEGCADREACGREAGHGCRRAAPDLRGAADAGEQAQRGRLRRGHAPGGAPVPAQEHDLRGQLPAQADGGRAGAAAARQRLRQPACAPCASAWCRRPASSRTAPRSTPKAPALDLVERVHEAGTSQQLGLTRRARQRSPSSSATRAPSSRRCAPPSSCPRARPTTLSTWSCRSSSTAATSGTTCRSTQRATSSCRRASATRTLTLQRHARGQEHSAGALAHHHRRLALRAGHRRLRVLPLQDVRRRTARDPSDRLGPGLDRAVLDADSQPGEGQDHQRRGQ